MDIAKTFAHINGSTQYFYATDANFPESGITGDMTIQAWVRMDTLPAWQFIVGKYAGAGARSYWWRIDTTGEFNIRISADGTAVTQKVTTLMNLSVNTWYHLAMVYDASAGTIICYKNGNAIETLTGFPNSIFDGAADFTVGWRGGGYFDGSIAYLAIFDDIRTPQEIEDAYTYPKQRLRKIGNIIGYWWFDDLSDATRIFNGQLDSGRDLIPTDGGDTTYRLCGRAISGNAIPAQGWGVGTFGVTTFGLEAKSTTVLENAVATSVEPHVAFAFRPVEGSFARYDDYVIDAPDITRGGTGMLSAGSVSITLDNTDQTWNIFRSNSDNVGQGEAKIGLWFDTELDGVLWLFQGTVVGTKTVRDTYVLEIRDKFAEALGKTAGQAKGNLPVHIGGTTEAGIKAGDMLWTMLTNDLWGGLSDFEGDGNVDINYASYLEWFVACNAKNYLLRARFAGQTLQTGLSILAELTHSLFWIDNEGKINFTLFDPDVSVGVSQTFTIDKCFEENIEIQEVEKFNRCLVYYGYDFLDEQSWTQWLKDRTDAERWVGSVVSDKQERITKDDLRLKVFEQKIIWHVNATGAQNFAEDFIKLNSNVQDRVEAETPFFGFFISPGSKVRVNHVLLGMTATTGLTGVDDYLITTVNMNLGTGYAKLDGFAERTWDN